MPREGVQHKNPLWLKLLAAGLAALILVAAVIVMVPQFLQNSASDVVMIKADPRPFKEKPKDPGGMEIPHQDTTVMAMLTDVLPQNGDPERLRPPSASPEMPPTPVIGDATPEVAKEPKPVADDADNGADGNAAETKAADSAGEAAVLSAGSDNQASNDISVAVTDAPATEETATDEPGAGAVEKDDDGTGNGQDGDDAQQTTQAVPTPKPDAAKRPKTVSADGEPFYIVQLAAFRESGKAVEQAGLMSQKHNSRLNGATLGTMKVDTGDNGVFWRVVSEPLPRPDADTLCANLKRAGQDCILRKFNLLSD